ncbi:MAG: hypothetical protein MI923_16490 [Phycisphaerales bacterium]|nr:hypothetical protein [Phycisphaerales bacterium]
MRCERTSSHRRLARLAFSQEVKTFPAPRVLLSRILETDVLLLPCQYYHKTVT